MAIRALVVIVAFAALGSGCTGGDAAGPDDEPEGGDQRFPDVIDAELTPTGEGGYDVTVTMSSPYDTDERYADGWRVLTPDGEVLAEHDLAHHHADEQPFTRTRGPFEIPEDVDQVIVEGHDLEHGYGGGTAMVEVSC